MKLLVVLLALLLGVWLWRRGRRLEAHGGASRADAAPQPMISCARCGVHLPRDVAVPGRAGAMYCSQEHRREAEGG